MQALEKGTYRIWYDPTKVDGVGIVWKTSGSVTRRSAYGSGRCAPDGSVSEASVPDFHISAHRSKIESRDCGHMASSFELQSRSCKPTLHIF